MREHSDRTVTEKASRNGFRLAFFRFQRTIAFVHSQSHQSRSYFA